MNDKESYEYCIGKNKSLCLYKYFHRHKLFCCPLSIFFLEKDNLGLLCITNIVLGIISGLGLMFLCNNRNKAENYERFVKMKRIKIHLSRIIQ